jgi:hypothetical protein
MIRFAARATIMILNRLRLDRLPNAKRGEATTAIV